MRLVWISYCAVLLVLALARLIERIWIDSGGFFSRYLPLILTLVMVIGIYASLKQRRLFVRGFWLSVVATVALIIVSASLLFIYLGVTSHWGSMGVWLLLLSALVLIPGAWRLRTYSAKSNPIWANRQR